MMAQMQIGIPSATLHVSIAYPPGYHWRLSLAIWCIRLANVIAPKQVAIEVETTISSD
jgi:hypothetical protein